MTFAQPLLLFGLLGAAAPIIIHLLNLRRPRRQAFAAMELLERSIQRVQRRWRLKRLLLLVSRVALLASLVLAASGPTFESSMGGAVTPSSGPKRVGLVIDASLSMRAQAEGLSSFERALREAKNIVYRLGPEDQATIVLARSKPRLVVERPTNDRNALLEVLRNLQPTYEPADLGEAATMAAQSLAELSSSTAEEKTAATGVTGATGGRGLARSLQVVVLSDLTEPALGGPADLSVSGRRTPATLTVIDVLAGVELPTESNVAITSIEAISLPARSARTVELKARIRSFSGRSHDSVSGQTKDREDQANGSHGRLRPIDVTLRQGEQVLEATSAEIVEGTTMEKVLRHTFSASGLVPVELALQPDRLSEDDVRHVVVDVERAVRTLIVDGAPSGVPKEDEIFYLDRALTVGAPDHPPPAVVTVDDLSRTDLEVFDVVVLAGVPILNPADAKRLVAFVERGGGLLVTSSLEMDFDFYNTELGSILPRRLRGLNVRRSPGVDAFEVVAAQTAQTAQTDQALVFEKPDGGHPVTDVFLGEGLGGLVSTRTYGYVLLEPSSDATQSPMTTLLSYGGYGEGLGRDGSGLPALVAREAGRGRVAFLTTSIDRELTDLPIRPAFVPLVRRLLLFLGRALSRPESREFLLGGTFSIHCPSEAAVVTVTGPAGAVWRF